MPPNPRDQLAHGQYVPLDRVQYVVANALRPILANGAHRDQAAALIVERLGYFRLLAQDVEPVPIAQQAPTRPPCANDTNGDGDCAACARNPDAPCRKPRQRDEPDTARCPNCGGSDLAGVAALGYLSCLRCTLCFPAGEARQRD